MPTWEQIPEDQRAAIMIEMDALEHEALYNFYSHVNEAVSEMANNGIELWSAPQPEVDRVTPSEFAQSAYQ